MERLLPRSLFVSPACACTPQRHTESLVSCLTLPARCLIFSNSVLCLCVACVRESPSERPRAQHLHFKNRALLGAPRIFPIFFPPTPISSRPVREYSVRCLRASSVVPYSVLFKTITRNHFRPRRSSEHPLEVLTPPIVFCCGFLRTKDIFLCSFVDLVFCSLFPRSPEATIASFS